MFYLDFATSLQRGIFENFLAYLYVLKVTPLRLHLTNPIEMVGPDSCVIKVNM